ncbi:c-type cytochrome [Nitrosomonas sp. Nm166]|uniref:c-type cytochrome n=1 Tax=Nitrosomonas sp. Nm166 TaxID=1881054 RepID=UPI0008EB6DC4|nr:c-type cytochrome [Nitrosomonas sp. Nm166]SFE61950.1 Cytochrome c [Nitrosomonas sp. Nm166]
MKSTEPLIKNSSKKALVIGSISGNKYLEENRIITRIAIVFALAMVFAILGTAPVSWAEERATTSGDNEQKHHGRKHPILPDRPHVSYEDEQEHLDGQAIFRFDTFGDEQLWTDVLRMHEVIATVNPATALAVGLKVDVEALPQEIVAALRAGQVDLTDPAVTVELLRLNAVVGVKGSINEIGQPMKVGITCALCHSSVDNSLAPGIGKRLDGWANTDLNVGAIIALSPALDEATKAEFNSWGPGMYDPRHHYFDGTNIIPLNSPSLPVVIPPIYGLKGVGFETYTADGRISYWNSYVGVGQMGGHGSFSDPRINITITQTPDLVSPKLPALLNYQLSLQPPEAPEKSFDQAAAHRGKYLFHNEAGCATCHQSPNFTDVRRGPDRDVPLLHDPSEVGTDPRYAMRTANKKYRTTPLRGLLQHPPYFHDGSARDLPAVVNHYDRHFGLNLTTTQKADLVEYLKSL